MNIVEKDGKVLWKGYEKIKLNLIIEQRRERNWTHYDITMIDDEHNHEFFHRSQCYGGYSPPYLSHYNDEKFDKKVELNELYKRLFHRKHSASEYRYLNFTDTEVEIGYIKIRSEKGYPIKFDLI